MASWNKKAYNETVERHPVLAGKTDAVALAVWAYEQNPEIDTAGFRELSEQTGITVAGRAVGSAREILGMKPATKKPGHRKKAARKQRQPARAPSGGSADFGSVEGIAAALKTLQRLERDHAKVRDALEKIRGVCDAALSS